MSATIIHYTAHELGEFADALPVSLVIECDGCGRETPQDSASAIGRFRLCPSCTQAENQMDATAFYQGECEKCHRVLTADDGRTDRWVCAECAARERISA